MPAFEGKADTTAPFPTDIVFFYMSPDRLALCNWLWLPNWSEKFQVQALRKSRSRSKSPASINQYPAWPPWTRHKSANDTAASIKSGRHNVARSTPTPAPPSPAGTYPAGTYPAGSQPTLQPGPHPPPQPQPPRQPPCQAEAGVGARLAALSDATATVTSKNLRNMAASSFGLLRLRASEQGRHVDDAIILSAVGVARTHARH